MKCTITLSWKGVLAWAAKEGAIQHIKQSEILSRITISLRSSNKIDLKDVN